MILPDRHCNADQLKKRVTWLPWQKQLEGTQLESAIKISKAGRQINPRASLKKAQKLPLAEQILPPATQPRLQDRLQPTVHFMLQCQGMPSFTKQGQGIANTASVEGWALQAPAELNLAGSFMLQQIKQWQQRWSLAAHPTSASTGTRHPSHVLAGAGFMHCLVPWR